MVTPDAHTLDVNPYGLAAGTVGVLLLTTIGYHVFEKDIHTNQGGGGSSNWKWHVVY